jgi:hypothetical protein
MKLMVDIIGASFLNKLNIMEDWINDHINLCKRPDGSLSISQFQRIIEYYYANKIEMMPSDLVEEMSQNEENGIQSISTGRVYQFIQYLFYGTNVGHSHDINTHLKNIMDFFVRLESVSGEIPEQTGSSFDLSNIDGSGFLNRIVNYNLEELKEALDSEIDLFKRELQVLFTDTLNLDHALSEPFIFHCLNIMNMGDEFKKIKEESDFFKEINNDRQDGIIDYTISTILDPETPSMGLPVGTDGILCDNSTWLSDFNQSLEDHYNNSLSPDRLGTDLESYKKDTVRNILSTEQYMDHDNMGNECNFSTMHEEDASDQQTIENLNRCITEDIKDYTRNMCKNTFDAYIESRKEENISNNPSCSDCKSSGNLEGCKRCIENLPANFLNAGKDALADRSRDDLYITGGRAFQYRAIDWIKTVPTGPYTQNVCDIELNQNKLFTENENCQSEGGGIGHDFANYLVNQ